MEMKKVYYVLLGALLALLLGIGVWSLFGNGETVSAVDGKTLAEKPKFSVASLLDGTYLPALEQYYSDHFPMRDTLLTAGKTLNRFYYYSGTQEDSVLILNGSTGAEQGGERLDSVEKLPQTEPEENIQKPELDTENEQKPTADMPELPEEPLPDEEQPQTPPEEEVQPPDTTEPETPPELEEPDETEASWAGNVIVVGTRAMEIPSANEEIITRYGETINALADAMGESVRTISIVTPNGGEFYSPESMHTGIHSQKSMIEHCYAAMAESIVKVDAYSGLRDHVDEYIYFRTDHHWTQLGAYYAYEKFCEAAGFTAVTLDAFETGVYENFVGSMYTFTKGYPQSETLYQNPDTLTYYLPIYETHAKYYADASLENGVPVSVVYTQLSESTSNKYLCYIGGDTPVCVIESAAEGGTCIVLKESYGNAFVPFLTSHYSKVIVIDPREFNRDGKPTLDLTSFAAEQGIDDLIVINYPYMINNSSYITWLERLVNK